MKRYFTQSAERRTVGAVHALGTGRVLIYGQGPEWMQIIGAPYSCPTMASLRFADDGGEICAVSERAEGTSEWVHSISKKPQGRSTRIACGTFRDCANRAKHVIVRRWTLDVPVTLCLESDFPIRDITALMDAARCRTAFAVTAPQNAAVCHDYPVGVPSTVTIGIFCDGGDCTVGGADDGSVLLTLSGTGTLYVCGGGHFPAAYAALAGAVREDVCVLTAQQREADAAYLAVCRQNRLAIRREVSADDEAVSGAIEDVLFAVRAQQSEQGGVMAGHAFHLASVREQYGVLRGLLSMGDFAGARAILQFCLDTERRFGCIHSAHGMGEGRILHMHENDNTVIPAYLVLSCTAYLRVTDDRAFFAQCLGMCGRAMQRAMGELVGGMMPFNGSEAYITDGSLPRTVIEQGSLEATALFIAAAEQLESACRVCGCSSDAIPASLRECRAAAELAFDDSFARRGGYTVNAPKREEYRPQPLYRHGMCYFGDSFGWLKGVGRGCYVCPGCVGKPVVPDDTEYRLPSVYLTLPYIGAQMIGRPILAGTVGDMLSVYRKTGRLPAVPQQKRTGGCDFGYLLYAAAVTGTDAADLISAALAVRDESGMWSESYARADGAYVPSGMRCRPWESAVIMDGILRYLSITETKRV